jgi:hypothetical protein
MKLEPDDPDFSLVVTNPANKDISYQKNTQFLFSSPLPLLCFCLFVLFCFVLFCFVLFCFVLFCFVLFCFVLFCFVLFCFVLFCFVCFVFVCLFYFVYFILFVLFVLFDYFILFIFFHNKFKMAQLSHNKEKKIVRVTFKMEILRACLCVTFPKKEI